MSTGRKIVLALVVIAVVVYGIRAHGRAKRRKEGARIVDGYVQATGGAAAYQAIRTMVIRGKGTFMGKPVSVEEYRAAPCQYYAVLWRESEESITTGTDGATAWAISNRRPEILIGGRKLDCLRNAAIDGDVRWRDFFDSAECVGMAEYAGRKCYKVIMTPKIGSDKTRYYDVGTNYLLWEEYAMTAPLGTTPPTLVKTFEDYRPFGKIVIPARQTETVNNVEMTVTVEDVSANVEIQQEQFAIPGPVKILQVGLPGYLK
jgi:hypothetical protein